VYIPILTIGALTLDYPVLLAPLANVTDSPYRLLCRRSGAALVFTEMVSAEGVVRNSAKTWALARFQAEERPIGIQLFSHDPVALGEAAARLEVLEPDLFDINFGCPVRKVVKRGAGAGFMEDPARIAEAVRQVVSAIHRPLTVKFRTGPKPDRLTVVEAALAAQEEGAAAVTVHGRTTDQGFKGKADWEIIARVKQAVRIPVIGNGDVFSAPDMRRMLDETGCDGVMIGRGSLGNPWIFSACRAHLRNESWNPPTPAQMWELVEYHYRSMIAAKGARGMREMRKYLGWYSKGLPGAADYRACVFRLEDPETVLTVTQEFFQKQEKVND
jgi:tRNA-dihydrouridine synthase B